MMVKFRITRASTICSNTEEYIIFDSLDALLDWIDATGYEVIVSNISHNKERSLLIVDDYL